MTLSAILRLRKDLEVPLEIEVAWIRFASKTKKEELTKIEWPVVLEGAKILPVAADPVMLREVTEAFKLWEEKHGEKLRLSTELPGEMGKLFVRLRDFAYDPSGSKIQFSLEDHGVWTPS